MVIAAAVGLLLWGRRQWRGFAVVIVGAVVATPTAVGLNGVATQLLCGAAQLYGAICDAEHERVLDAAADGEEREVEVRLVLDEVDQFGAQFVSEAVTDELSTHQTQKREVRAQVRVLHDHRQSTAVHSQRDVA